MSIGLASALPASHVTTPTFALVSAVLLGRLVLDLPGGGEPTDTSLSAGLTRMRREHADVRTAAIRAVMADVRPPLLEGLPAVAERTAAEVCCCAVYLMTVDAAAVARARGDREQLAGGHWR